MSEYEHCPEFQGVTWRVVEANLTSSSSSISPQKVRFDEDNLWVLLTDGRTIGVPLVWFPRLLHADQAALACFELSARGIHWDQLNEDISVQGLLDSHLAESSEVSALSNHAAGNVDEWKGPPEDEVWG